MSAELTTRFARLYDAFNAREIDQLLEELAPDVDWPNAWEGGRLRGHDEVRAYWTRQWKAIDSRAEARRVERRPDGAVAVEVQQTVRQLEGELIEERRVLHVYRLRDGLVSRMDVEELE
jgi:hypothetical protein